MNDQMTEKEDREALQSYVERRIIREQLEREGYEGVRVDIADKCICSCGQVHYRKREMK